MSVVATPLPVSSDRLPVELSLRIYDLMLRTRLLGSA